MEILPEFDRTKEVDLEGDLHFQALTWNDGDFQIPDTKKERYEIFVHGVNANGNTVCLNITGFTPYFYVEIPDFWDDRDAKAFYNYLKEECYEGTFNNNRYGIGYGLAGYDVVKRTKLYPYLAGRKFTFIRLKFTTNKAFSKAKWLFSSKNQRERPILVDGEKWRIKRDKMVNFFTPYESNVNHLNRFYHIREIESTGWLKVYKSDLVSKGKAKSRAQLYFSCHYKNVFPDPSTSDIAPLTVLSYDLECLPSNTKTFPNPQNPDDIIAQIGIVLAKYGTEIRQKIIINIRPSDPIDDVTIITCENERELLQKFIELITIVDHDLITGYNTWGFDDQYLWGRIKDIHGLYIDDLSRIVDMKPNLLKKEMSSSAYGNNEWLYIDMPGRETIDLLVSVRREGKKLESYSLNSVGEAYLNEHKVDLPYAELFKKLVGSPADIKLCSEYCVQDSNLVVRLMFKLCLIPNYIEMAKATFVPMNWLLIRGQQCKSFSLIVREARKNKYVVPVHESNYGEAQKFKGATVIEPSVGLYYEPVAGLDFASLYPSIMCAYNMCYSTYVATPDMLEYVRKNNIPHHTIEWTTEPDDDEDLSGKVIQHKHTFVQPFHSVHDENDIKVTPELQKMREEQSREGGVQGLLGTILMNLWQGRKATKKLMKAEKDPFKYAVLDGKQLAQKVTMNSMYGFTGAESSGMLPLKAIASSVTATGRKLIDKTAELAEERYGATLVYGDSVTGDTPVLVRIDGIPVIKNIQDLVEFDDDDKKQHKIPTNYIECWTENGWTRVQNVMRHKTNKKIIRVLTHTGCVDVTEDHSLIRENGEDVTPNDLKIGDKLLQHSHFPKIVKKVDLVEARNLGIQFCNDSIIYKTIPNNILFNNSDSVKKAFLQGLIESKKNFLKQKSKISCAQLSYLLRSLNYIVNVDEHEDTFILKYQRNEAALTVPFNQVKKIRTIIEETEQYVYDLTTENHHFQAGIGDIIVHNTDSCYVIFPINKGDYGSNQEFLEANFKMAKECADYITNYYKKPIELEFEKFMWPFYLFTKKRYAYKCWERTDKDKGLSFMGLQIKRRDTCKDVRKRLTRWFDIIMDENLDVQSAIDKVTPVVKKDIQEFMKGDTINHKELVVSSQLKSHYIVRKNNISKEYPWTHPEIAKPHVRLAQMIKEKDPVNYPRPPERVPYMYIQKRGAQKQCDKVIHPDDYDPKKHKLDLLYYFDHQFKKPIDMFFEHLTKDTEKLYKRERISKINEAKGQRELLGFFKPKQAKSDKAKSESVSDEVSSNEVSSDSVSVSDSEATDSDEESEEISEELY